MGTTRVTIQAAPVPAFRYRVFVSYSHQDDGWARWPHRALESYAVPRRMIGRPTAFGPVPRKLWPTFRVSDELGRRDVQRRTRRAVALAVVAAGVMAITSALAVQAWLARHAAERRQKEAEDLVAFMLGDLNDKLAQVARLDVMAAVDDRAIRYFQAQPADELSAHSLAQRVSALEKIGSVRLDQGQPGDALASYQAALPLAARLAGNRPQDAASQAAFAEVHGFIGIVHWRQGRLDDAQTSYAAAQAILRRALEQTPDDPALTFQLALVDNHIGHVMEMRGQLDDADKQYRRMLVLMRRLVDLQPANGEWAESLGIAYNNLGKLALMRGDLGDAVAKYSLDERLQTRLSLADPKNIDRRGNLISVQAILGRTQALAGDVASGMERLQHAVDEATELAALDPSNADLQEQIALYGTQLARLRRLSGDLLAAIRLTTKAESIFLRLTRQDPSNAAWQREYAETLVERSAQWRALGDAAAARQQAQAALRLLTPLRTKQPDDRATVLAMASARLVQANASADPGTAHALRVDAFRDTANAKREKDDPRLLALRAEALLALERKDDAAPLIERLRAGGYRDAALLAVLRDHRVDYPADEPPVRQVATADGGALGSR
ncbi:hypothetical protein SAMN02800692_0232 [Luteibacter sp. UNC138MFCol5.1]|uniref:hypothetical protein n=1 Tax=Luteibacter sp. UNC138MFCol5.1 TaxID=1502774 RepID=UPI0008C7CA4C|nr:hypothetical protein [Luteibacter sp. UNC138MFCol5.1]SEO32390.1 hypothetical protein SAMN02800692_0232 [Luteibacter sp. UNC138MFCol5.1]